MTALQGMSKNEAFVTVPIRVLYGLPFLQGVLYQDGATHSHASFSPTYPHLYAFQGMLQLLIVPSKHK